MCDSVMCVCLFLVEWDIENPCELAFFDTFYTSPKETGCQLSPGIMCCFGCSRVSVNLQALSTV